LNIRLNHKLIRKVLIFLAYRFSGKYSVIHLAPKNIAPYHGFPVTHVHLHSPGPIHG
jgi:hypothetical protein